MLEPVIIPNVFTPEQIARLHEIKNGPARIKEYDPFCGRYIVYANEFEEEFSSKLESIAREVFEDNTIKTSYSYYVRYAWENSILPPHLDMDAGEYTIDYCLSQRTEPWPIYIGGKEYILQPNEILCFVGSKLEHYRDQLTDYENNEVEMILFHFEPGNSWFFDRCEDFQLDSDRISGESKIGLSHVFGN
jgi:hypothetical protein